MFLPYREQPWGGVSRVVMGAVLAVGIALGGGLLASAQDSTPEAAPSVHAEVVLENGAGEQVGTATVIEADGVIAIAITVAGLEPGDHGIQLHNPGVCESPDGVIFEWSDELPDDPLHSPIPNDQGTPVGTVPGEPHAGDLGNITVAEDGTGTFEISTDRVNELLGPEHTLADHDGSVLTIQEWHQNPSEPMEVWWSGPHIVCGVIAPPIGGTPVATPAA